VPNMNFENLAERFYFRTNGSADIHEAVYDEKSELYKITFIGDKVARTFVTPAEVETHLKNCDWIFEETLKTDPVNKPSHYHKNEIDVNGYLEKHFPLEGSYTVAEGFYIGNVIKYTSRYKDKNGLQDLEKAKFNLNKLIELEEKR
jgi:hypothetical protein